MNGATASDQLDKLDIKCSGETHENVEDSPNICRICATVTDLVIPIFEGEGLQNNLAEKIHKHLPIKVSVQDVLPQVVCYQCSSTVLAWHELVQCCQQADQALRQQAANRKKKPVEVTGTPSDPKGLNLLTSTVRDVLNDYCQMLNINQDNSDIYYVCQECDGHPVSSSIETLSQHLQLVHSELSNEKLIEQFIKDNIFIEEVLISDELLSSEDLSKQAPNKELPNYSCPFCESMFSSPTRLVFHLNRHLEVCIDDGVYCCNQLFNNKTSFVTHLQSQHVHKVIDSSRVCKSCGLTAGDLDELQKHINDNHPQAEERYERGKTEGSPKCQKFIPAVCSECNKTFSNKYNMLVHMRNHFGQPSRFACDKCNKTYKSQGSLIYHHKVVHEGQLKFVCSSCGEAFPSRAARDVHARLHTGQKPFSCQYCGKAYRAKNTLYRHIDMHLNIRKYACSFCDKKFRKSTHLKCHLRTHERTTFEGEPVSSELILSESADHLRMCKYCDKEFPEKSYGEHLETIHSVSFFRCHECDGFIDRSNFVVHMTLHAVQHAKHKDRKTKRIKQNLERGPARNVKCDDTGSDVTDKMTKNDHRVEGGGEEKKSDEEVHEEFCEPSNVEDFGPLPESVFEAIEDSREYQEEQHAYHSDTEAQDDIHTVETKNSQRSPAAEQTHKQRTRSDNAEVHNVKSKIRKCPKCDKVYVASSSYFYHLKYSHNQNKEHECDVCGKKFGTKASLSSHTAIHGADWRYPCRECDKRFRTRASLYIHQQTHSGIKAHRCSRCGRCFRWRTHLLRHETRHLAHKSHVCETCGRGFSVRCDLLRHARTHAAGAHVCGVCGHTFAQLRYLRVHAVKKHSGSGVKDEIKP